MTTQLEQAWELAKQRFAAVGIDVEEALRQLDRLPVSMHCWQEIGRASCRERV